MAKRQDESGSILAFVWSGASPAMRPALITAAVCAALTVAVRIWIEAVHPLPGDWWVRVHFATAFEQPLPVRDVTVFFSVIGAPVLAVVTLAAGTIYAVRAEGLRGLLFLALCAAAVAANVGFKQLSGSTPLHVDMTRGLGGLNFPSGHVVYAVTVLGGLAVLARRAGRTDVAIPLVLLVLCMGPARVVATAHFVSDVVAGYLVGFGWLVMAAALTLGPLPRRGGRAAK